MPIGADYYFHLQISREWLSGVFAMFGETAMRINQFPYFSFLHFLLIPSILLHLEYVFARCLQVVFYSLSLGLTMLLSQRRGGYRQSALTGLVLMGCLAYTDAAIQVRPQGLAFVLLPLALGFYASEQKAGFAASVIALVYTHGIAALSMVYSLVAVKLVNRAWTKTVLVTALLCSPIVVVSLVYAAGAWGKWSGLDASAQEPLFWAMPQFFIPLYSGATLAAIPLIGYVAASWRRRSSYQKMLVLTVLGSLPMLALWPDRWLQYCTIPFALLVADMIVAAKVSEKALVIFLALYLVYQLNYWYITLTGGWYVPAHNLWIA
jgi:hypothetical protein